LTFADIAVPVPLPDALTYRVPEPFLPLARPGARARVQVGRRRLTGVIVRVHEEEPTGFAVRDLGEIVDREPVVPEDLLELVHFTARYYLAPIGEVLRAILPGKLPPWGTHRVWLTSVGALGAPRSEAEGRVIEALREGGRMSVADLQRATSLADLGPVLDRLQEDGRIASGQREHRPGTARYLTAVELAPGTPEELREACGRSVKARGVVDYLGALGRPAKVDELTAEVGCSESVVRRLATIGVLRRFTQIERLELDRHMFSSGVGVGGGPGSGGGGGTAPPLVLREDQRRAVEAVVAALRAGEPQAFLLAGMTGSGKTEVYLRAAETALERGRSVILLVPEIALVPALAATVRERFGLRLALLHSNLSASERHQEWERARRGEARVVLGPRSALFAPVRDLGLIVVDEEQDSAYKQEITPRYHGRDLALVRARQAGAVALLASATPSLESRHNARTGRLSPLALTERAGQGSLPEGILVDLRREGGMGGRRPGEVRFSEVLRGEIERSLGAGDQIILLRNRRGYSPILLCRACGEDLRCEACGLPRTFHRREGKMLCHYCGSRLPAPRRCTQCGEAALEPVGSGTERVEEEFTALFPGVAVDTLDRDAVRRPGGAAAVLERFGRGEIRVLVGTQMVSKGHHFPRVALTAVLAADTYLGFPDFRAVEKTYNLLTQLAGRAGRGERPGRVVIQTFHPEHYAIQAALNHDDEAFAREEMRFRRVFHYPPYTRMIQFLVRDKKQEKAAARIRELADALTAHPLARGMRITGPAPAPLERIQNQWRFQLLIRDRSSRRLHELVRAVVPANPPYDLTIDVDPCHLL